MEPKFCGPCPETECAEVRDDETVALKTLYERMLDKKPGEAIAAAAEAAAAAAAPSHDKSDVCEPDELTRAGNSVLKRFDVLMTAVLESRTTGLMFNDLKTVPHPMLFSRCKEVPPGSLNTTQFGLDVERAVLGPQADQNDLLDAADALMQAEAGCKHSGAVRAAEVAAQAQPEPRHAEDAARIGAKAYTTTSKGGKPGKSTAETPIEVVGYVGCTKSPPPPGNPKCP